MKTVRYMSVYLRTGIDIPWWGRLDTLLFLLKTTQFFDYILEVEIYEIPETL